MADDTHGTTFQTVFDQGSSCWAFIPSLDTEPLDITIEGIEHGGIWIQCQRITDMLLREMGKSSFQATPIVFVPYSAIRYAFVLKEGASLSAEKLGL